MQRRAAAVYLALFVFLGAGAYGFMQVGMAEPAVDLDGPAYGEGDELTAGGVTYTVSSLTAEADEGDGHGGGGVVRSGELAYEDDEGNESTLEFEDGSNVTLGGTAHFAHFQSNSSVQILPTDEYYGQYQQDLDEQEYFHERENGFWGVVILSFVGAILLLTAAYLPNKG